MTLEKDGQFVQCDGEGCTSRVSLPIALRPVLSGITAGQQVEGWLFAAVGGKRRHYCPNCLPTYLGKQDGADDEYRRPNAQDLRQKKTLVS